MQQPEVPHERVMWALEVADKLVTGASKVSAEDKQRAMNILAVKMMHMQLGAWDKQGNYHRVHRRGISIDDMIYSYNLYWHFILNKMPHFTFRYHDSRFITLTYVARRRNKIVSKFILDIDRLIIIDAFAGVGSDALTFRYDLKPLRIDMVEKRGEEGSVAIDICKYNMKELDKITGDGTLSEYRKKHPEDPYCKEETVMYFQSGVAEYLRTCTHKAVGFMWLDPPWIKKDMEAFGNGKSSGARVRPDFRTGLQNIPGDKNFITAVKPGEASVWESWDFLYDNVFYPMNSRDDKLRPRLIGLKTRFGYTVTNAAIKMTPGFEDYVILSCEQDHPFINYFCTIILMYNAPQMVEGEKDQAFRDAYARNPKHPL